MNLPRILGHLGSLAAVIPSALAFQQSSALEEQAWFCEPDGSRWVDTELGRQKVGVVLPEVLSDDPTLLFFVHADSPNRDPVYQYDLARKVAQTRTDTIVISVLRPGYRDGCGDVSDGIRGRTMGDNYTAEVVDALATILARFRQDFRPARTVIMGHSGGAALSALLASRYPHLQDEAVLVACPCELKEWRTNMRALTGNSQWGEPMAGLSPFAEIAKLDPELRVRLFVGSEDRVTPPFLSEQYVRAARAAGKQATYTVLKGADHDMILDSDVLALILGSLEN